MAEEHRNRGDEIISGRIRLSTRKTYDCKFGHFNEFMKQNHEEHFIGEKLILLNVKAEDYKEFFAFISVKKEKGPFSAEVIPMQYNSYKYVESYSNAIKNSFRNEGSQIPADCEMMLTNFFRGYSRKVADLKQNGEMPLEEGKSPLSFDGYQYIARKAMGAKKNFAQSTFCWVFIVLCWNLMARSASVSAIMFEHIHWRGDAMTITFPKHKGDQDAKDGKPKHVFANPLNPAICPVLALAIFVFTNGPRREGSQRLLFGKACNAETRFSDWIRAILGENAADLMAMGIMIMEIGTHSFRKGIATFLAGLTSGPTAIAIYLRAGWSLGLQKRYIMDGSVTLWK